MTALCARLTALGATIIVAATVLGLLAQLWWIADLFSNFRIQYIVAGLVLFAAALLLRRRTIAIVMLGTIGINAVTAQAFSSGGVTAEALPAADATGSEPTAGRIRIVSANVRAKNPDPGGLVSIVESETPDVLLVIEHTEPFADALGAVYPYQVRSPHFGTFGIALYSRLPLVDAKVVHLGGTDAVRARIDTPDGEIRIIGTHLLPPMRADWAKRRNAQLVQLAQSLGDDASRTIVCGDFNLTPYSPYFAQLVDESGLRPVRTGRPLAWTWPAGFIPLGVPIDHCLTGEDVRVTGEEVLGDIGSDHYPLRIDISLESNG